MGDTGKQNKMILLTGANGFVGRHLSKVLPRAGWMVREAVRLSDDPGQVAIGNIGRGTNWALALRDVAVVVHTAAMVHIMGAGEEHLQSFREVNVEGTRALAEQSARAGVKRFIFLSSIKVNGESTAPGVPFVASDPVAPQDPYARSKSEAEALLKEIGARTGMEIVIIRPPMVYGPGSKGNFSRIMALAKTRIPLPFGAVRNRRSMVCVQNLASLVEACLDHLNAADRVFLVSDNDDVSTGELVRRIGAVMGYSVVLVPVPPVLLQLLGRVTGRSSEIGRLLGSLAVDIAETRAALNWEPPLSMEQGLKQALENEQDVS